MHLYKADAVVDYSASDDTTAATINAPFAGHLFINECFVRIEEVVGSMTTTEAVVSIEVAGIEVAISEAVAADAVGSTRKFTVVSPATDANGGKVKFAAGDAIAVLTKTQAVDGTVTGTGRVNLAIEYGD